ncbi:MAG: hypothetical protein IJK31_09550 [Ruminococcus sp.]|nr:hypothetical protein [Ruminococcus sp.]
MKRFIPLICIAAVLAGCGKVDQASKKDSMPVVKGGMLDTTNETEENTDEEKAEKTSEAKGQSDNFKPVDKVRGEEKQQPSTRSAYIAGQRTGSAPPQVYIPKPVKPPARQSKTNGNESGQEDPTQNTPSNESPEKAPPRAVFSAALGGIFKEGNIPGYGQIDISSDSGNCKFAVTDLEGDGNEEMIFVCGGTSAQSIAVIYGIDEEGKLFEKAGVSPDITLYSNGTLISRYSHAAGPSGDFMPYTLLKLSADGKKYEAVAAVDAIDKASVEAAAQEAAGVGAEPPYAYPEEYDTSNSGKVYLISSPDGSGDLRTVDVTEYESWLAQYTGGASVISPDYKQLTTDNISELTR